MVADQLHNEICSHRITIAQAAKTLEGDWLSKGLPMMTRLYRRLLAASTGRGRRMLGAVLAAAALGGCGVSATGTSTRRWGTRPVRRKRVTQLSEHAMRSWCPAAVAGDGRQLTQAQARDCLRRAWNGWLGELERNGYDPNKVGEGK